MSLFLTPSPSSASLLSRTSTPRFFTSKPHFHLKKPSRAFPSLLISRADSDPESRINIPDEWGEKSEPQPDPEPTLLPDSDSPNYEDEWEEDYATANGTANMQQQQPEEDKSSFVSDLKRCLVDTVYGTELGFRAGPDVRAEVLELVNQLEAANPTPCPVDATAALDGNWVLL